MRPTKTGRLTVAMAAILLVVCDADAAEPAEEQGKEGTVKWQFDAGAYIQGSPTLAADGTIYIGGGPPVDKLFALSPDGKVKWSFSPQARRRPLILRQPG